jgi:23S rRNA-/tRNA-specific pseudouridylate synthase
MTGDPDTGEPLHLWNHAGIIVVDKPRGPSSHQVAAWVGKMLGCQVGHAGTLDPQVSGVLLIMLGNAVRLAPLLLQHDKEYICVVQLHGDVDEIRMEQIGAEFTGRRERALSSASSGYAPSRNLKSSAKQDVSSCSVFNAMPARTSVPSATIWGLH